MSVSKVKVSQHISILLEAARAYGMSAADIKNYAKQGDLAPFASIRQGELDYQGLIDFAKEYGDTFEQAVTAGYETTFNTIRGIKYLLAVAFGKQAGEDYRDEPDCVESLRLHEGEVVRLRSILSRYWAIMDRGYDANGLKVVAIILTRPE